MGNVRNSAYLAIDLGAESGRAILGTFNGPVPDLHEVHRFTHAPLSIDGGLHWDMQAIWTGVLSGIRAAVEWTAANGARLESIGVDTWGVDFGLLDARGDLVCPPRCYRDPRHALAFNHITAQWGGDEIYNRTGIQLMPINSLFQLASYRDTAPDALRRAARLLFMPDLLHYWLSGQMVNEATIASTSQMIDIATGDWRRDFLDRLALPHSLLTSPAQPTTVIGGLCDHVRAQTGAPAHTRVVLPACHDTASAVAAVPANPATNWCYLSNGTWSLLGAELPSPCVSQQSRLAEFTNERGIGGVIRFQKNMTGMWIIAECRREWQRQGQHLDYEQLMAAAANAAPNRTVIDPSNAVFSAPGDMPAKIAAVARSTGQPVPATPGEFVRACIEGLSAAYARAARQLGQLLNRTFDTIHIVGGGSRNHLLNQLTAEQSGLRVVPGPVEATAIGNLLAQRCAHTGIPWQRTQPP